MLTEISHNRPHSVYIFKPWDHRSWWIGFVKFCDQPINQSTPAFHIANYLGIGRMASIGKNELKNISTTATTGFNCFVFWVGITRYHFICCWSQFYPVGPRIWLQSDTGCFGRRVFLRHRHRNENRQRTLFYSVKRRAFPQS